MSERYEKILKLLLAQEGYVPLQKIAAEMHVSKRSIYYDICRMNEWLDSHHIRELEIVRGSGIRIVGPDKNRIEELIGESKGVGYIFLPTERVKIIICCIIQSDMSIYVGHLMDYCQVSRNTIFGDLCVVANQLNENGLTLEYESKKGYTVTGDNIRIRALYFLYFNELSPLFENGILKFANQEEIQENLQKLKQIEEELQINYVEGNLRSLAALLPIMYKNKEELQLTDLKQEGLSSTKEFELVREYFPDLPETEKQYLCLHLLGSRVNFVSEKFFESRANQLVYELVKSLVTEFERIACVEFEKREELERSLFVHINTAQYRYQYGIQIGNPMREDIIREYPDLIEITRVVARYWERMAGLTIPDSEVGYLALHFGAHLKIDKPAPDNLRILIVCASGISTGKMLERELQRLLPSVRIAGVIAAKDLRNVQDICDLIISTVRIKSVVPLIIVHPILTDEDRKHILNHSLVAGYHRNQIEDSLFEAMKKYVKEEDYKELRKDIIRCLFGKSEQLETEAYGDNEGLTDYLPISKINITGDAFEWQESIHFAGQCLVECGTISEGYLDEIIAQILRHGNYMFLTDEVVLAHAKPEYGVNQLDVSMTVFKTPVQFPKSREGKIIFVLAARDQEKHLKILNDILRIIENQRYIDMLLEANFKQEILKIIRSILSSDE